MVNSWVWSVAMHFFIFSFQIKLMNDFYSLKWVHWTTHPFNVKPSLLFIHKEINRQFGKMTHDTKLFHSYAILTELVIQFYLHRFSLYLSHWTYIVYIHHFSLYLPHWTYLWIPGCCSATPGAVTIPSYIKDSTHALKLVENINRNQNFEPKHLFTNDVIPHSDGLKALQYFLNNRAALHPPTDILIRLLRDTKTT